MSDSETPHLDRGLTLTHATSLNVSNMLGAGPFFTMPLILLAMGGPQCMLGWLVAMLVVMCDGLVWAELGAAMPGSGGTYHYFREVFRGSAWGRFLPFLFIWQFLAGGTLELSSGYNAASRFTLWLWPDLEATLRGWGLETSAVFGVPASFMVVLIFLACCQQIRSLGKLATILVAGVLAAVGTIIVLGILNFDASLITFPQGAFDLNKKFLTGLGAAMGVAVYDYLGYYNICHLGEEVRTPNKTIPRAVLLSIVIVATIYVLMNLSFIGVIPWQEIVVEGSPAYQNVAGVFMTRLCGERIAAIFTILVIWTCLASVFAMTLGYSRILYAAAKNGDFFSPFAALHPTRHFPWAALALLSGITAVLCYLPLEVVVPAAVVVRIALQFIGQIFALHELRRQRGPSLPFRMWLYPLPSLLALIGWVFLLASSEWYLLCIMMVVYGSGLLAYIIRDQLPSRHDGPAS
jgi:amino acid transporter